MKSRSSHLVALARTLPRLGATNLSRYALHRTRLKTGWYARRHPIQGWQDFDRAAQGPLRSLWTPPSQARLMECLADPQALQTEAASIRSGKLRYFSGPFRPRPTHWQDHPLTGRRESPLHWASLPARKPEDDDIKWVWEPARFAWVFPLGRAFVAGLDDEAPEQFFDLLASFRAENPPFQGVHWACGQECALRLAALLWARGAFAKAPGFNSERQSALAGVVAALAERIDLALVYARAQHNNHGLGEALGLYLAGFALADHPRAKAWTSRGRRELIAQCLEQFATDGSYAQNSTNYHRVALRYLALALHCAKTRGDDELLPPIRERLLQAVEFLLDQQEAANGSVPNYGANDGANPHALSSCPYRDHRPVLQALYWLITDEELYGDGPWNEELLWLGHKADGTKKPSSGRTAEALVRKDEGGYYILRGPDSFALLRCHAHRSRPSHADMLHLDLWWGGDNLLADGGTFAYSDPEGWGRHFKATAAHNTVEIGGQSQMREGSKFLWLDWTQGELLEANTDEEGGQLIGEHPAYCTGGRGFMHRRLVRREEDCWLVIDDLWAEGDAFDPTEAKLRWHFGEGFSWKGAIKTEDQELLVLSSAESQAKLWLASSSRLQWDLLAGDANDPYRSRSPSYGQLESADVLILGSPKPLGAGDSLRWITAIGHSPLRSSGPVNAVQWREWTVPLGCKERLSRETSGDRAPEATA